MAASKKAASASRKAGTSTNPADLFNQLAATIEAQTAQRREEDDALIRLGNALPKTPTVEPPIQTAPPAPPVDNDAPSMAFQQAAANVNQLRQQAKAIHQEEEDGLAHATRMFSAAQTLVGQANTAQPAPAPQAQTAAPAAQTAAPATPAATKKKNVLAWVFGSVGSLAILIAILFLVLFLVTNCGKDEKKSSAPASKPAATAPAKTKPATTPKVVPAPTKPSAAATKALALATQCQAGVKVADAKAQRSLDGDAHDRVARQGVKDADAKAQRSLDGDAHDRVAREGLANHLDAIRRARARARAGWTRSSGRRAATAAKKSAWKKGVNTKLGEHEAGISDLYKKAAQGTKTDKAHATALKRLKRRITRYHEPDGVTQ